MSASEPIRVLLVDDQVDAREWLAEWLRQTQGFEVATAGNSEDALTCVQEAASHHEVILMDIRLGSGPDGIETMKRVRGISSNTEVIITTGFGGVEDGIRAMEEGAYNYIIKPLNRDQVVVNIRSAADKHRTKDALLESLVEREWLQSMLEISNAVQSTLHLDQVLKLIVDGIHRLGYDRARLYLLDGDALVGRVKMGETLVPFEGLRLPLDKDLYSQKTLETKEPAIFHQGDLGPDINAPILGKEYLKEWAELPLVVRGKAIGKLAVDNKDSNKHMSARELTLLMLFANQAANAIENARLYWTPKVGHKKRV